LRVKSLQAAEKDSPASLRSIASLQRIGKYASARRFLARLASEAFLNSLNLSFSTLCLPLTIMQSPIAREFIPL
jgi:hypothetical protein